MKPFLLLSFTFFFSYASIAQQVHVADQSIYQATPDKIHNMVHTKVEVRFDYTQSRMPGKAWITLAPHFYATDSLTLDAKGMDIRQVAIVKAGKNIPLKYSYDNMELKIKLDKKYTRNERYTIYVDYVAKPDEYKGKGSAAITDAKGLYFINPRGEEEGKPTQIWTQGETEATSVWVPVIDNPNQKTTQEIIMTVPSKYVTLSNGKLVSQKPNADGTRTDHWKMDLPHAPYLFFMGVGDYAVIKDQYKGKEVSYYVEKEYASVARKIFGLTPEMLGFFSRITGVEYPWNKYAQMTARDYVSGAMENTTATLHSDIVQQDARQLTDQNIWEDVIAHEAFHQWFGNIVTTESWSNLSLNESFANYSEYLWREHKYGKDAADDHGLSDMQGYLGSRSESKDLIRFNYHDKEEMFDAVSYNKGGRILHMLRNFIGDSAFFKSLNLYLTKYRFQAAEAHQLRLAFEEVTGKDLNWFFNQWYFGAGHPKLNIQKQYISNTGSVRMIVEQTQGEPVFQVPVAVDVWNGLTAQRYTVWLKNKTDTFFFPATAAPSLVNFDAEKVLLSQRTEHKTTEEYVFQYRNSKNYIDRREALDSAFARLDNNLAIQLVLNALRDPYAGLRTYAITKLDMGNDHLKVAAEPLLFEIAQREKNRLTKAAAIAKLGTYRNNKYANLFRTAVNDSSYTVAGNALEALSRVDSADAANEAKRLSAFPSKGRLASVIRSLLSSNDRSGADQMLSDFEKLPFGQEKFAALQGLFEFLVSTSQLDQFKRGVDALMAFQDQVPAAYKEQIGPALTEALRELQKEKIANGQQAFADYIELKLKNA
ncbi:MAG: M1 family metallopeptidase [Flavisolibacter sp.]|jgi:aminopeptidase N|nr:M1 family metallopeptidase [Flavisolibacter sp.]